MNRLVANIFWVLLMFGLLVIIKPALSDDATILQKSIICVCVVVTTMLITSLVFYYARENDKNGS